MWVESDSEGGDLDCGQVEIFLAGHKQPAAPHLVCVACLSIAGRAKVYILEHTRMAGNAV